MKANGTAVTNLTAHAAFDSDPTWSPDGSRIAFNSTRNGPAELYVMNADDSSPTQITFYNSLGGTAIHADWSPDGQWIMRKDGSNQVNVTNIPTLETYPAWSR